MVRVEEIQGLMGVRLGFSAIEEDGQTWCRMIVARKGKLRRNA